MISRFDLGLLTAGYGLLWIVLALADGVKSGLGAGNIAAVGIGIFVMCVGAKLIIES